MTNALMKSFATLLVCVLALFVGSAAAQPVKIGYIDTFRIERESAQALRAAEALKKEFSPRQKELEDAPEKDHSRPGCAGEGQRQNSACRRASQRA